MSSSPTSKLQSSHNMLLAYPPHLPTAHSLHHHSNHHTAIRTPPRMSSPKLASLSLAESSVKPPSSPLSSSHLIMDQQGEIHDPSYLSTLRTLHAEIGARASPQGGRRRSSSSGLHAPSRPSQLGLGLSGRDVDGYNRNNFSSDDDSDSDDDDLPRGDSYNSIFHDSAKADRSQSFSSPRSSHFPTPPRSPLASAGPTAITQTPTHEDEPSSSKDKPRRASWSTRRREQSSKSSTPRLHSHGVEGLKSDDWGFTGLVDLEREQRVARASIDQLPRENSYEVQETAATEPSSPRWKSSRSLIRDSAAGSAQSQRKPSNLRASHSGGSSGFWSMSHSKAAVPSAMRRQASLSSLNNYASANDHLGLSTIVSGRPMQDDDLSDQKSTSATSDSTTQGRSKMCRMVAQLHEQQQDADFLVGPSKYKQSKDMVKKKTHEWGDTSTQAYELRRKMENLALGVRFGAFKAKKKIERTLKE
jgi:hypothetical protein